MGPTDIFMILVFLVCLVLLPALVVRDGLVEVANAIRDDGHVVDDDGHDDGDGAS